jgi:hypothetical protein
MVAEQSGAVQAPAPEGRIRFHNKALQAGFTQIPRSILHVPGLSRGAKLTWIALAEYAWSDTPVFPGQAVLAATLEVGLRTVVGDLQELRKAGLLQSHRRGLGLTNEYTLLCPEDVPAETPPKSRRTPAQIRNIVPIRHAARCATDMHPTTHPDTQPGAHPIKEETDSVETDSVGYTPHGVGADAPPPAQKQPRRATKAPKPKRDDPAALDTADLPYRLSEAILLAADRPATRGSVLKIISAVKTEVIDAYRGQGVMFTDAKACLAYMQTHPDYAGLKAKWITWEALAKELGPWLKAGKPAQYVEPVRAKPQAAPPRFVPSMIPERPLTKEAQEWEALVKARDAKRAAEAQATGGVP